MKKIYQKPIINIVAVQLQQMIAESVAIGNDYNGATIQSRRRNDVWDDDDEDYDY